jgi:hypothetical protein
LDVGVGVGVRDGSTVWVGGAGVNVRVGVCVAVDVAEMGVREGVSVSAAFVNVGVESGRDDWQAVRIRTKMKSERLSNMVS